MSNFIVSCGGTGGHLSPGIALAEELIERGHKCWLIISKKEVDARLVKHYPNIEFVRAPGVSFSLQPVRFLNFLLQQFKLLFFAFGFLRRIQPDTIIAFGGFLAVGIALSGFILGRPVVLHEANRKPGKATRLLRGLAHRIYLPSGVLLSRVSAPIIKHLGYPLRKRICCLPKEVARKQLGLDIRGKLLVVIGGSQGAQILNEWVMEHFESLATEGINVYCVTGLGKGNEGLQEYSEPPEHVVKAHFTPFTDDMGIVLSSADLVVSRAGAGAIAELIQCGVPSILIPYPYAADNHQLANAHFLEQQGSCIVLEQTHMKDLYNEAIDLIFNDWLLNKFRQNLKRLKHGNSALAIAQDLEQITLKGGKQKKSRCAKVEMPA